MSLFEPVVVKSILKNALVSAKEKKSFDEEWETGVKKRLRTWNQNRATQSTVDAQLKWQAHILQYVDFVYKLTKLHGNKKSNALPSSLRTGFPILGPRFLPPAYLHVTKRDTTPSIEPKTAYLIPFNVVHPFYYPTISRCPQCSSNQVLWDTWTATGHREVHGLHREETVLGMQLRCRPCEDLYGKNGTNAKEKQFCFASTSASFWKQWEHWKIPRGIPYFFNRCAVTRNLFDLIVELRPSSTSAGLAENIKQLHLLEYRQQMLEYLQYFDAQRPGASLFPQAKLARFSDPYGPYDSDQGAGYDDRSITHDLITDIFLEFSERTRKVESDKYLRTLTGICLSLDNTFRAAGKAVVVDKAKARRKLMKGGILSVLNERNEIISWRFCQSQSPAEIREVLQGIQARCEILSVASPEMVVVDNCCQVRGAIMEAIPSVYVSLDVYHCLMRYVAVVINGVKNPFRNIVAKDIVDSLLKSRAKGGQHARYWTKEEQERLLVQTFEKWSEHGGVWSAAASKVHSDQLAHVRKGCLARPRQDIRSDGSRIEGSHKGWNSIQRSFASGLEVIAALGHDFVLRRNLRIANASNGGSGFSLFALSTYGSHHVHLIDYTAHLWNALCLKEKANFAHLPTLSVVLSEENFGVIQSEYTDTFGGLIVKDEDPDGSDKEPILESLEDRLNDLEPESIVEQLGVDLTLLTVPLLHASQGQTDVPTPKRAINGARKQLLAVGPPPLPSASDTLLQPSSHVADRVALKRKASDEEEKALAAKRVRCMTAEIEPEVGTEQPGLNEVLDLDTQQEVQPGQHLPESQAELLHVPTPQLSFKNDSPSLVTKNVLEFFKPRKTPAVASQKPAQSVPPASHDSVHSSSQSLVESLSLPLSLHPPVPKFLAGLTPTERVFSIYTGMHPQAMTITTDVEFFLFMELRAEYQWATFNMTSRKWAEATAIYNAQLTARVKPLKQNAISKNPRALMDKLVDIEAKILKRIATNNFISKTSNSDTFWTKHCTVIQLTKVVPAMASRPTAASKGSKARKQAICNRCRSIMYPGPTDSPENHKKGYCSDGAPQKPKDGILPPWPQPLGIFAGGTHFFPIPFLSMIREIHDKVSVGEGSAGNYTAEDAAFSQLLVQRTVIDPPEDGGAILFKLYDLIMPDTTPERLIVQRDGIKHLRIDSLRNVSKIAT